MTHVINLFGGSGLGKTTTSFGLAYHMKLRGLHMELVREYVKTWAWQGRKVGPYDQAYIFGKQSQYESVLYGKVDYIVTDSPLLLSPIYETFYSGGSVVLPSVRDFLAKASANGVTHHNFLLTRHKPFDARGRYETADQAKQVDLAVKQSLTDWGLPFTEVPVTDSERVDFILDNLLPKTEAA